MKSPADPSLVPVPMQEAVGYPALVCETQTPAEHAVVLKQGRYFLITNAHGDIAPGGHCALGLFHDDTRILSYSELRLCGGTPSLLSAQAPRSYLGQVDLALTDAGFGGNSWDPKSCIHIRRELVLADGFIERVTLTNYLPRPVPYWIELAAAADFADIFEVRGWKREKRGQYFRPIVKEGGLVFSYEGLDGTMIQTVLQFHQPPNRLEPNLARWELNLPAKGEFSAEWKVCIECAESPRQIWTGFGIDQHRKQMDESYQRWDSVCTHWQSQPGELELLLERATDDLHALYTATDDAPVLSAGIPWYSTVFGRDAIITSIETLCLNPQIARDTLRYLARHQGEKEDPFTEEQPGKILHELRRGEMARNREIPHLPYYGTIDATPLWLILLHETWQWTGDEGLVREMLPHADRALEWIRRFGDLDGDGFVEYVGNHTGKGLANQGWKDSGDGVSFPDARLPKPPIALVEVQGYVYDAFSRMAQLYTNFGRHQDGEDLRKQAEAMRHRILERFWIEELGTFGLALDGRKNLIPTVTSNAGHLLWSGVPDQDQAERMTKQLLGPEMFSGWGIRTLSGAHRVFNPMSYHNGSVWPHDNALIVLGLARYGLAKVALPVVRGLYEAGAFDEFQRLPELFCGMSRGHGTHPVWYPVSCSPQAWASGALFLLLQAVLGIRPESPRRVLHIRDPQIPDFLNELTISNLLIGKAKVSLQFQRHDDRTLPNLLSVSGQPLQVRIELS